MAGNILPNKPRVPEVNCRAYMLQPRPYKAPTSSRAIANLSQTAQIFTKAKRMQRRSYNLRNSLNYLKIQSNGYSILSNLIGSVVTGYQLIF